MVNQSQNIIEMSCGTNSAHYKALQKISRIERAYGVNYIQGIMVAALDDIEKCLLIGQEFLIAGEIFDSVMTKYLKGRLVCVQDVLF
jgi:hypothetical protein